MAQATLRLAHAHAGAPASELAIERVRARAGPSQGSRFRFQFQIAHKMVHWEIHESKADLLVPIVQLFATFTADADNQDKAHDIAILSPNHNDFEWAKKAYAFPSYVPKLHATSVTFDSARPRDGEEIFLCGYPLGAGTLTTASGHIATAWGRENLETARKNGIAEQSDVFDLDLNSNPGNSGGPVFLSSNQSVIGLLVEGKGAPGRGGWLATAVPARYITALLERRQIPWQSSASERRK